MNKCIFNGMQTYYSKDSIIFCMLLLFNNNISGLILISLLTARSRVIFQNLIIALPVTKFPAFYGNLRCITMFITAHHWTPSWATCISPYPQTISWRQILIWSSHLHLDLTRGLFPLGYPTTILYAFLMSYACYLVLDINNGIYYIMQLQFVCWSILFCRADSCSWMPSHKCNRLSPNPLKPSGNYTHHLL
jgi:hypothetical protein